MCALNRRADGTLEEIHPLTDKKHEDIRRATQENTKKLPDAGYTRIRGCERNKMKKQPEVVTFFKTLKSVEPRYRLSYQKILDGVQNDFLYDFLFVDIETPEHQKKLADFPRIIKNVNISRADKLLVLLWRKLQKNLVT